MTTGNRVDDYTVSVYTGCGQARAGDSSGRSWSGSNSPDPQHRTENPYSTRWWANHCPVFGWHYVNSKGQWAFGGDGTYSSCGFMSPQGSTWFLDDNDTLNLQSKILSKIKGSDLNLAVTLAEGKETISMLSHSSLSVWRAYRSVRKGDISGAWRGLREENLNRGRRFPKRPPRKAFSQDLSQAWLSLRYGWQPFLQDIYAGLQFLESRLQKAESSVTRFSASVSRTQTINNGGGPFPTWSETSTCRYSVIAKVNTKWLSSFRTLQACGVLDPELIAWEVLPYSFVVDWFLPIGTWLEDRAAIPRIGGTFVFGKKVQGKASGLASSSATPGYRLYGDLSGSYTYGSFDRTIGSSWSVPLPSFRNPLAGTWKHVADTFALWRGRR